MVRGVAWRICWRSRKSSKKFPELVLGAGDWVTQSSFIRSGPAESFSQNREPNARLEQRETDEDVFSLRDSRWLASLILRRTPDEKELFPFGVDRGRSGHDPAGAGGFRRRHEERLDDQGHDDQGLDEKG